MGRFAFGVAFAWQARRDQSVARYALIVLYRTLGESLPSGFAPAASLWGISQRFVRQQRAAASRAGFAGNALRAGNALFDRLLNSRSGMIFAVSDHADSWLAVGLPDHRINLCIDELLIEMSGLASGAPAVDPEYPYVLSAGERRSDTSNTSIRDASWHRRGTFGALRMHPDDAAKLGCTEGDRVGLISNRGRAEAPIEFSDQLQQGHVSLPNGHGIDYTREDGRMVRQGVSLNELTDAQSRDPFAGTPSHKYVPVRIERIAPALEVAA